MANPKRERELRRAQEIQFEAWSVLELLNRSRNRMMQSAEADERTNPEFRSELNMLDRKIELKNLIQSSAKEIEVQITKLIAFEEMMRSEEVNKDLRRDLKKAIKETNELLKIREKELKDHEREEELLLREDQIRAMLSLSETTEREKKAYRSELEKVQNEQFSLSEARREKQQKEKEAYIADQTKEQMKSKDQNRKDYDSRSCTDRVLLGIFNDQMKETLNINLPEVEDKKYRKLFAAESDGVHIPILPDDREELARIMAAVDFYVRYDQTANDSVVANNMNGLFLQDTSASYIYRHLTQLCDRMTKKNENPAEYEPVPDELYFAAMNLLAYFEREMDGKLGSVPEEDIDSNARQIRYIGKAVRFHEAENDKLATFAYGKALRKKGFNDPSLAKVEADHTDRLLFPHAPSLQDIQQGWVGDCFFVSTLSQIAATHPEEIKEMIRDNKNGTATVRLFYWDQKKSCYAPLYVTVDKSSAEHQASRCIWVQIMEKALAVSGLLQSRDMKQQIADAERRDYIQELPKERPVPVPEDIEKVYKYHLNRGTRPKKEEYPWLFDQIGNFVPWEPNFDAIKGASAYFGMEVLLGDKAQTVIRYMDGSGYPEQQPKPDIPLNRRYTKEERSVEKQIRKGLQSGKIYMAGTGVWVDNLAKRFYGISQHHAYALLGLKEKSYTLPNGKTYTKKFVVLRNPHGSSGRSYQLNGDHLTSYADLNIKDGISEIELSDFYKEFYKLYETEVKPSSLVHAQHIAETEKNVLKSYASAIDEVNDYLNYNVRAKTHSSEYNKLKSLVKTMRKPAKSYAELKKNINSLKEKISKYEAHAVTGEYRDRPVKKAACRILKHVIDACEEGYIRPIEHTERELVRTVIERMKALNQDDKNRLIQRGTDPALKDKEKEKAVQAVTELMNTADNTIRENEEKAARTLLRSGIVRSLLIGNKKFMKQAELLENRNFALTDDHFLEFSSIIAEQPLPHKVRNLTDVFTKKEIDDSVNKAVQARNQPAVPSGNP